MRRPGNDEILMSESLGKANEAMSFFQKGNWESSPLSCGDRVFFLSPIGTEYPGTVVYDWDSQGTKDVVVLLDGGDHSPISLHRSQFRAFTVLDHLAEA
jgi:hypothetical protein